MDHVASSLSGLLAPGATLHGRYRIVRVVGRGGMSAVYEAEHVGLAKRVAVKEMAAPGMEGPEAEEAVHRFQTEARTLAQLEHRYFPDVTDFFSENGRYYLVMNYVEGETLEDLVKRTPGFLSEDVVLRWAIQLCDVLSYLHSQSPPVVFRDLKPSNIMIDSNGQVKLIDFGIARFFKPGKASDTQTMGTAGYSAPEQYGTGQTDARSDVYSLGACLHFLLTTPQPTSSPFNFPPVRETNPKISANMERVVARCLAMKPEDRYPSAADVKKALSVRPDEPETTYLTKSPRPVAPATPSPIAPLILPERAGPSPGLIATLVFLIVAAAGVGGYFLYKMHQVPPQGPVPDVVGMDKNTAQATIQHGQFTMSFQGLESSDKPEGEVTRETPPAGSLLAAGQPVNVWFSRGPDITMATVPDVSKLPEDRARTFITDAGLMVGQSNHENSDDVPKGYVIRSAPPANMKIEAGQAVDIVISDGPAPPPTPPTPAQPTPPTPNASSNFDVRVAVPADGTQHEVKITVEQDNTPVVAYDDSVRQNVKLNIEAPSADAISATVDGKDVTPQVSPLSQPGPGAKPDNSTPGSANGGDPAGDNSP